jgi:hypothetical protein
MGQEAQLTGGYGNSHAQMAGQGVYNDHLREVAERVPQLKEAARADYDADTDALLRNLGLLMDQDSTDYARWMDELERQLYAEQLEYERGRDALSDERHKQEWEYQTGRDRLADQRYQDELAYGREQDQYQRQQQSYDRLLELIIATGYKPTAEELAAAGMTEAEAKAWLGYYTANQTGGGSGGGGGYSGGGGGDLAEPTGNPVDDSGGNPTGQNTVLTRQELGDPFQKEDYTHVYANCAVLAGNDKPASEIAAYIKQAFNAGSITQEQYNTLMKKFGNLVDSGKGGSSSGGRGSGSNNRYDAIN